MIERFIDDWAIGTSRHWNAALRQFANEAFLKWRNARCPNHPMNCPIVNHQSSMDPFVTASRTP
jgi:hypothetical protein